MVMFVQHKDGRDFFNFNIPKQAFKIGQIIDNDALNGKHQVVHLDGASVTVRAL